MAELIKKLLGASWLVTILGWLMTALGVTSTVGWKNPDGSINWIAVAMAIIGAVLSRKLKQDNVTGGTVSQPTVSNPPQLPAKVSVMAPEVTK